MIFYDTGIFGFDCSMYQTDYRNGKFIDFQKMKQYGASFVIVKCGQYNYKDPTFDVNWQAAKEAGLTRMSYWFEDVRDNGKNQAMRYWSYLNGDIGKMLWIDFENGSGSWHDLYDMVYQMQALSNLPDEKIGIYTNYYYWLEQGPLSLESRKWFANHPLWIASYNPVNKVQIPPQWTECLFWQSGTPAIGQEAGVISKEIDYDKFNGDSIKWRKLFGVETPVDIITKPFPGIQRISGSRQGWKFELFISDPSRVRYKVICLDALETVTSVAKREGAQYPAGMIIGTNGGEWDRVNAPKDYSVSDGTVCRERVSDVPSLNIKKDNSIIIYHKSVQDVQQALSGLRYLIVNGVIQSYLEGSEPQYTEGHARSIHGVNDIGQHMVLQSEGTYPNQGLTLKQAAEIMRQYGAVMAFDSGGGGDVSCVLDGQSLIVPENIDATGKHFERPLPQVFLIFAEGEVTMNEATAIYTDTRTRPNHNTLDPYLALYPAGTKFHGDTVWINPANIYDANGVLLQAANDKWLQVLDINGTPVTKTTQSVWVAIIHKSKAYCTLTTTTPPPADSLPPRQVDVTDKDGVIWRATQFIKQ